jgi:hypothetical protein
MYGSQRAHWAGVHSSGAERSHWFKVAAIQRNREGSSSSSNSYRGINSAVSVKAYKPRHVFSGDINTACSHCSKPIEQHTPIKKMCPI